MSLKGKYELQAFEVEDIDARDNFVFIYNPYDQSVEFYETSVINNRIGHYKKDLKTRYIKDFPFECDSAYDYYVHLYNKSIKPTEGQRIFFWLHVNPISFEPLVDKKKRKSDQGIANADNIKSQLISKQKEFCSSIKSRKLRKIFRKDTYFAGGAISSLLRGEEPNDYDIFFKSQEALNAIVSYYVEDHNLRYEGTNDGCRIGLGGGKLILSKEFVMSDDNNNEDMNPIVFSERAITFPGGFQLILKADDEDGKAYEKFDFVHCMGHFNPFEYKLTVKEEVLAAVNTKQLIYNSQSTDPMGSSKRLLKFVSRGWEITNKEHMKVLKKVSQIEDKNVFDHAIGEYVI